MSAAHGSSNPQKSAHYQTVRFLVPVEMVGKIIGKGGWSIKEISKESKARVWFDDKHSTGNCCVIQGTLHQVRTARQMIDKKKSQIIATEKMKLKKDQEAKLGTSEKEGRFGKVEERKVKKSQETKFGTNVKEEIFDQNAAQVLQFWLDDEGLVIKFTALLTSQKPEVMEVNKKLENRKPKNLAELKLAVGEACAVQTSSGWRRAQLLGCEEGCDARVILMDEGTKVTVPTTHFSPLPKKLSLLPALARTYKLGVTPMSKAAAETAVERLTDNLCKKEVVVILDILDEQDEVPETSIRYLGGSIVKFLIKENLVL